MNTIAHRIRAEWMNAACARNTVRCTAHTRAGNKTRLAGRTTQTVARNNSRRGHVGVQRLQTRADSGIMSACCSWRGQSLGWARTS
jgi:hypothetical protein